MKHGSTASWLSLLTLVLLAGSAWLSHTVLFRQDVQVDSDVTRHIASSLGRWHLIDESRPSENEIRGLETRDIIKRVYSDGHDMVELVVAYIARSSRKSAHAQEACLRGSGALVGELRREQVGNLPIKATIISIDHHNRRSWVYYWYKMGDTHTSEYLRSSWRMFVGGLIDKENRGTALVRILSPQRNLSETRENVQIRLQDFATELLPELENRLP